MLRSGPRPWCYRQREWAGSRDLALCWVQALGLVPGLRDPGSRGPGLETWHLCPSLRCRESLLCQSFLFAETFFKQIFSSLHTNGVAAFCPL